MHRRGVPEGVRTDTLVGQGGAGGLGLLHVFAENISNPETREGSALGIEKDLLSTRVAGHALSEIGAQGFGRFRPQRATAVFLTFAQQVYLRCIVQP